MHYIHHTFIFNQFNSSEEMKTLIGEYVHIILDSLNKQFPILLIFNASKLFSLKHYSNDNDDQHA
jgi:hypothetical protein